MDRQSQNVMLPEYQAGNRISPYYWYLVVPIVIIVITMVILICYFKRRARHDDCIGVIAHRSVSPGTPTSRSLSADDVCGISSPYPASHFHETGEANGRSLRDRRHGSVDSINWLEPPTYEEVTSGRWKAGCLSGTESGNFSKERIPITSDITPPRYDSISTSDQIQGLKNSEDETNGSPPNAPSP